MLILPKRTDLLVWSDHKLLLKIFTGHTDNDKCNLWGLDAASIHKGVKVQHIKGIAYIPADSVSRLKSVDIYHDVDPDDYQQEFITPVESLPPVNQ